MSKKKIFDNILNQFSSEDEEENEEDLYDKKGNKILKHKSTSSLTENMNNGIKDILPNITNENEEKKPKRTFKRDQFGYFINDDENDDNSEESNSIKIEQENDNYNSSNNSEKENNENENENLSNKEEEEKNSQNNLSDDENENKIEILEKEENSEEIKDNNNEIIENNINSEDKNNKNDGEEGSNNEYCNEDNEQNDLINELYRKSSKNENLEIIEGEELRKMSFRPKPIPGSPNFKKKISDKNLIINNNFNLNNNEINNNINNNNLSNFTETIETKIEGDITNKNLIIENEVNKNDINPENSHKNIISLGKLPNKDNLYPSEFIQNDNINNTNLNTYITYKIEESNNIDEEKENEYFLIYFLFLNSSFLI